MSSRKSEKRQKNLPFYIAIGQRLKTVRKQLKLNQEDIVSEFGIGRSTVSEWENGKYPPDIPFVVAFTKKYGVNIMWFLEDGDHAMFYSEAMEYALKEAREKVLKISDQHSAYNNEGSTLNLVTQYLKENPDLLESVAKIIEGREGLKKFEQGG